MLYCHGNAESLETLLGYVEQVRDACHASVYVCEYPGYWRSSEPGVTAPEALPSEAGTYAAAMAVAEHLAMRSELPLVVLGYSLGTAPALHVAASERLRKRAVMLVLVAPLLSAMGTRFAKTDNSASWSFLYSAFDVFKTEHNARSVTHHTVLCHGTEDEAVPFSHGSKLSKLIPKCTFCPIQDAHHDTVREGAMPYIALDVQKWLRSTEVSHAE